MQFYSHITNDDLNTCFDNLVAYIEEKYEITVKKWLNSFNSQKIKLINAI